MKKLATLLLITIIACMVLAACGSTEGINSGTEDILYNDIVYERCHDMNYNLYLYEDHSHYIGDFIEIYAYGQEFPYPVHVLNDEENVLFSPHAVWVKPGYSLPDNFGVELSSLEYVIRSEFDFNIIEDNYTEEATLLITFTETVMLEDIVDAEPSEIAGYVEYDEIRCRYTDHADMGSVYTLVGLDGNYYLNVSLNDGSDEWHKIKEEYVELITSAIPNPQ
jgi:predicted small secreted protein